MNLEQLYLDTKSKAVILINKEGKIVKSFSEEDYENAEDFSAVTKVIINMLDNFFTEVLSINPLSEIIIKTEKHSFYITKCDTQHVLCVLSDGTINTSLISLSLKKILKNQKTETNNNK